MGQLVTEIYRNLGSYIFSGAQLTFNPCEILTQEKTFLPLFFEGNLHVQRPAQYH